MLNRSLFIYFTILSYVKIKRLRGRPDYKRSKLFAFGIKAICVIFILFAFPSFGFDIYLFHV